MEIDDKNEPSAPRLSAVMQYLAHLCDRQGLTLGDFLHELSAYGHMLVCLIFAIPFMLPVPLPGLSTLFGFVICVAALQLTLGLDPWVPASWRRQKISGDLLKKIFDATGRVLRYTEKVIRPRLKFFARHPGFVRFNGLAILIAGLLLSLPMPPGFNAPPALSIIVLSIGSLERDGVLVLIGYTLMILNIALFAAVFALGFEGLQAILGA